MTQAITEKSRPYFRMKSVRAGEREAAIFGNPNGPEMEAILAEAEEPPHRCIANAPAKRSINYPSWKQNLNQIEPSSRITPDVGSQAATTKRKEPP